MPAARHELLTLATTLDKARLEANDHEATAPQTGVYGDIVTALIDVIRLIVGSKGVAEQVYEAILDGMTVAEALDLIERQSR